MKRVGILGISVLTVFQICAMSNNTLMFRSFSSYISRNLLSDLVMSEKNNLDKRHMFSVTVDYVQNFGKKNQCTLGAMPFWSGSHLLTVGNNDGDADFDAYQLGLGEVKRDSNGKTILGSVQFNPKIQQVGADIALYFSQSEQNPGWYVKLIAPLGAMMVTSNFKEIDPILLENNLGWQQTTKDPGSANITYQFRKYPTPQSRQDSFVGAFLGATSDASMLDGNLLDVIRLRKGRMIHGRQEIIRLADIAASFGYMFVQKEKGSFGAGFKVSCPTGNIPSADYIFEPIFGRAGMWGIGGELKGQYELWRNSKDTYVDLLVQSELLHVRSGRSYQYRSFDLKQNGPGSKYLLIQNYRPNYDRPFPGYVAEEALFPDTIQPAINITTLPVCSKFLLEGSIALALNLHHHNWRIGLGADFWGRSREKLSIDIDAAVDLRLPNLNDFAVLGRQISGYQIDGQANIVNTYYCEPLAQINASKDPVVLVGKIPTVTPPTTLPDGVKDARIAENRIPKKLDDALDICGAEAQRMLHGKLLAHIGYVFDDRKYKPSVAIQLGLEFSENKIGALPCMFNVACKSSIEF